MKISVSLTAYNHTEHGVGSYIVTLQDGSSQRLATWTLAKAEAEKLADFQYRPYGGRA